MSDPNSPTKNKDSFNENPSVDPQVLHLQEELAKQKETMEKWKKSVKEQLNDAQTKNRNLKQERDEARTKLLESDAAIRTVITNEFKERFAIKEEEVRLLKEEISVARQDRQQVASEHLKYIEKLHSEHESKIGLIEAAVTQKTMSLEAAKDSEIVRLQTDNTEKEHKIAVLAPKVTWLEKRLEDADAQIKALHMQIMHSKENDSQSSEVFAKKHLEDTQKYEAVILEIKEENANLRKEVENVTKRAQESHLQFQLFLDDKIRAEVQFREDQVQVLQVMLKQSQLDVTTFQHKCAALQAQLDTEIDTREAKISTIRTTLVNKMAELEEVRQLKDKFEKANVELRQTVRTLEEEQEARELIFNETILSGDDKQYISVLESQVAQAQHCQQTAEREVRLLKDAIEEERNKTNHAIANLETERNAIALQHRELDIKIGKLKAQENKVREQLSLLVKQADMNISASYSRTVGIGQGESRGHIQRSDGNYDVSVCKPSLLSDNRNSSDYSSLHLDDECCIVNRTGEKISTIGQNRKNKRTLIGLSLDINDSIVGSRVSSWLSGGVSAVKQNATPATVSALYNHIRTLQSHRRRLLIFFIVFLFISSIFYYQIFSSDVGVSGGRKGIIGGMTVTELAESLSLCKKEFNNLAVKWNANINTMSVDGATNGRNNSNRTTVAMMPMLNSVERPKI